MYYETIASALMAEGHCAMLINEALFQNLVSGAESEDFLRSTEITRELEKLAARFEELGKHEFCQQLWGFFGADGSRLAHLLSR
jgi:hypothetical protein